MKNLCILGATGSIGTQTLDVVRREKDKFVVIAISINKNYTKGIEIIKEFNPIFCVVTDEDAFLKMREVCMTENISTEILKGMESLNYIVTIPEIDMVVTALVGMVGLVPTIKAIEKGKDVALANKETLVVGGELVKKKANESDIKIFPVDSEHGAIFQCLQGNNMEDVDKILLTASGGPFREYTIDKIKEVTLESALKHPNWSMGKKITVDCATMMNKGLEVIEAHWLFNKDYKDIVVVVHPESIVHSMVQYKDGSVIAQMAAPDMRLPIQYALNYPNREEAVIPKLDFYNLKSLNFYKPKEDVFRCLKLAIEAGKAGYLAPTILNSANEEAVELFLNKRIKFIQISEIVENCLNKFDYCEEVTIESILKTEIEVKNYVSKNFRPEGAN